MIVALVAGLMMLVLGLGLLWLLSPAFRTWSERPKFQMLQREALYELEAARLRGAPAAELPDER
ncbi:MAG: hypothetical protein WBI05_08980 [Rhodoferax sp.]|uniref:hypothetical protein n=1 Tax=Rhodoferax sp. TaxID=50421 RepID=UPI003BB784D7